ncbi:peptidase M55 [Sulfobacillus thermotolerans]|uniref:Peptidase M55 n=1 Tax=Sulfobacillus thermotolerans TaxID=338644 RepID=A0ABM6RSA8_9FIRM|nr:peptidase M55 [Sulfobacillus thermotolerans]
MNVWISVDMEGISGIVDRDQLLPQGQRYSQAVHYLMQDITTVIGAVQEDPAVTGIVVNDSHDGMLNVLWSSMPQGVTLISGGGKPWSMVQGVDQADVAFFVGYHAMAGTPQAVMDHTYSGEIFQVRLNGVEVGETGLNAAVAGHYQVPVGFVSGDDKVCAEASQLLPWVTAVSVKTATNRRAAHLLSGLESAMALRQGVHDALAKWHSGRLSPFIPDTPVTLEVTVMTTDMADRATYCPGTQRTGGRTVQYTSHSMLEVYRAFYTIMALAAGRPLY